MKYTLITVVLLLGLVGCKRKADPDSSNSSPAASEECNTLETLYTFYNNYYTCNVKDGLFVSLLPDYSSDEAVQQQIELNKRKMRECIKALVESYETVSDEKRKLIPFFHNVYEMYKLIHQAIIVEKRASNEDEKTVPPGEFTTNIDACLGLKKTEDTNKARDAAFKPCFKELGDKAYKENKQKFKCQ